MKVIQLLPVYSPHDAVGATVASLDHRFREAGFESYIAADLVSDALRHNTLGANTLEDLLKPSDVLLYHLSIGSPVAEIVKRSRAHIGLVYQNITPASFYEPWNAQTSYWLHEGRKDLQELAPLAEFSLCLSSFNAGELLSAHVHSCTIVPPLFDWEPFSTIVRRPGPHPTILSVGRIAPNKRIENLIRTLAILRAGSIPDAQLRLIGSANDTQAYANALRALAKQLNVADAVELTGSGIDIDELRSAYGQAHVYLSASEHEGFCVPLIEAMWSQLPVIAAGYGAVPETVGDGGIVLNSNDPFVLAAAVEYVLGNPDVRGHLVDAGVAHAMSYHKEVVKPMFTSILENPPFQR